LLQKRIARALKKNSARRVTLNFKDARRIGILFLIQQEGQHQAMNRFVDVLKKEGKMMEAMTWFSQAHGSPYNFPYNFFTEKDIDATGKLKSQEVDRFIEQPFDYLYCICNQRHLVFDYILAKSQAKCRIGKHAPDSEKFFELMVTGKDNEPEDHLMQNMLHYTQAIANNTGLL